MSVSDVRKNFVFKKEVALHLKAIAKRDGKSMTNVVQELIEEKYEEISIKEKLEALHRITGCMNGMIGDDISIQSIKEEMGSLI